MKSSTVTANGNRTFPRSGEWAGDRPDIKVASYPKLLRGVAMQLVGCWLSFPVATVAKDWDGDPAINIARLNDILAHDNLLTPAQASRIRAALKKLQERNSNDV